MKLITPMVILGKEEWELNTYTMIDGIQVHSMYGKVWNL
jgi:hypothetical protein